MLKIGLRNARKRIWGLSASIIAVFLGVAFVASTLTLKNVINQTFSDVVAQSTTAAAYLRVSGAENDAVTGQSSTPTIPISSASTIAAAPGVALAAPDIFGTAVLVGSDGTAVATSGAPTLMIAGYDVPGQKLVQGRLPESAHEIAFTDLTVEKSGYTLGDEVTAIVNGDIKKFTLVGELEFGAAGGALVTFVEPQLAQELFAPSGNTTQIAVYAQEQINGSTLTTLPQKAEKAFLEKISSHTAQVTATDNQALELITGTQMRDESMSAVKEQVGFISTFILVFAGISVLVSGFVISNTFAMITRQQQREYALLRAIGASPRQVFTVVSVQAIVVGLIGGLLGLGASYGFLNALPSLFKAIGMDLTSSAKMDSTTIVIALTLGVVVSLAAAFMSARKAANTPPMEAMREVAAPQLAASKTKTVIGAILFFVGLAAATSSTLIARNQESVSTGALYGIGALLFAVGTILIAATIARPIIAVFAAPLKKVFTPTARLAAGNVQRNPNRTASTASALVLGTALTSAAAIFAASVNSSIGDVLDQELKADLIVQSQTFHISPSARAELAALDSVAVSGSFVAGIVEVPELAESSQSKNDTAPKTLDLGATEPTTMQKLWDTEVLEGDPQAFEHGEALVQKSVMKDNHWTVGQTLTLTGKLGTTTIKIGGVFESVALGVPAIVPLTVLESILPAEEQQIANIMLSTNGNLETLRAQVQETIKPYVVLTAYDQTEFSSQLTNQINQMLMVIYALLGLTIVIAILGIINTLSLGVLERTREIGLLRAVGLSGHQLRETIALESVFTALFGTMLGLFVGVGITLGIPTIFKEQGFTQLTIPWNVLGIIVGLSVLVGIAAALWPAIRAQRIPLLQAIGDSE